MNLLHDFARQFSEAAHPDRLQALRVRLPADILRRHVAANRNLAPRAAELESLADALERIPEASANPELYPFLIAARFANAALADALIDKIRWHAGLSDELGAGLTVGYHRSRRAPGVHREAGGRLEPVEGCWAETAGAIRVYFPRPGLFRDLLGADLYPDEPSSRPHDELMHDVAEAFDLVRRYDEGLHDELCRCFSVLVLTTDFGTVRSSFNLRLRYVGGLFLNPAHETPLGLAEGLVHEYYHQRIWHWWWDEPLDGLPGEDVLVTSPITGRRRPVPVMTHALVIYIALAQFHATLAQRLEGDGSRAAEARAAVLAQGLAPLGDSLRQAVPAGSRAGELLDLVGRLGAGRAWSVDVDGKLG
jgi:hypothetical protein